MKNKYPLKINQEKVIDKFFNSLKEEKDLLKNAGKNLKNKIEEKIALKQETKSTPIKQNQDLNSFESQKKPVFMLEIQKSCPNKCEYCYNIWKGDDSIPKDEAKFENIEKIIQKLKEEANPKKIILTGGEPLLRKDFPKILALLDKLEIESTLITNSVLLTKELIKECLAKRVANFQIPLLSQFAEIHNELQGAESWHYCVDAIINIKDLGGKVTSVFIATQKNIGTIQETLDFAISLGIDSFTFNRFNIGGEGIKNMQALIPNLTFLKMALSILDKTAHQFNLPVYSTIPIQPCLIDMTSFNRINPVFCGAGTKDSAYVIDGEGNLRPCIHTKTILGNILKQPLEKILQNPKKNEFKSAYPKSCAPCPYVKKCMGGCKAAAEVSYGSIYKEEPFLKNNRKELL
ncbi:MAG: radical SAM protein [Armatimonadetes bacterium]|nr:radical SAM protein [Armatimonadota bacterium]